MRPCGGAGANGPGRADLLNRKCGLLTCGQTAESGAKQKDLVAMPVGLWTTVASARQLQKGCRKQLMREIANRESTTLPLLDRLVAARGIGNRESRPLWHFHAFTGQQRGGVLGIALLKEVPPVLPGAEHTHGARAYT